MNIPLNAVIYFDAITTHPTTGAATDADSTPTFAVYEEATDTDIGVGGNLTKRTSLTGNYRGSFTISAANGFEVNKWYSIIGSATVNSIAGKAVLKNFRVVAAEAIAGKPKADVDAWLGTVASTPTVAGIPNVNCKTWNDLATVALPLVPTTAGRTLDVSAGGEAGIDWANIGSPTTTVNLSGTTVKTATDVEIDTQDIQSRIPAALSSGNMKVDVLAISGDTAAADNAESFFDGTGYGPILLRTTIATLTNQTQFTLSAGSSDDYAYILCDVVIEDQATAAQKSVSSALNYTGASKTLYLQDAPKFTIAVGDIVTILANRSYGILNDTSFGLAAIDAHIDVVQERTDNLPDDPADQSALAALITAVDDFVDTEVAAIKAKTDLIPTSPASETTLTSITAAIAAVQADLPQRITKNTALSGFSFFMASSTDGRTPATGLTVTATRSLDGAAFASCTNAVSEVSNGWYKIDLAAGDLNGNVVALKFTATGADARNITIVTQST